MRPFPRIFTSLSVPLAAACFATSVCPAQTSRVPIQRTRGYVPQVAVAPDIPDGEPTPDFPLRIHIVFVLYGGAGSEYHGYGGANLLSSSGDRGLDYTFDCSQPFVHNSREDETYQARWRKPEQKLELLMARVGSDHEDTCTLAVTLKSHAFDSANSVSFRKWHQPMLNAGWQPPNMAFTDPDPDYPVQFHVVAETRSSAGSGYGNANILGVKPTGVRFTYDCFTGFVSNSQRDEFFQGHWVKPNRKLEILTTRPGSDHVDRCTVDLTPADSPFPEPVS